MRLLYVVLSVWIQLLVVSCFQKIGRIPYGFKRFDGDLPETFPWSSPKFKREQLDLWWDMRDHFMTIGPAFVQPSHCNHLAALVHSHGVVRVKTSTDKVNPLSMVREFLANPVVSDKVQVLEIRERGAMFGRINLSV